jgi:chaperonin GroEL
VAGGGIALIRAAEALDELELCGDEATGVEIIRRAIEEPLRQIVNNAGIEGSIVVMKVKEGKGNFGYDAQNNEYVDMLQAGIIDPAKVSRCALQYAASGASMLLTTECMICDAPEEQKDMPAGGAPGMGGMGGMGGMM